MRPELETELKIFLAELHLSQYYEAAREWCEEMGAGFIDEVMEEKDSFSEAIGLKVLERKRLMGERAQEALAMARKATGGDEHALKTVLTNASSQPRSDGSNRGNSVPALGLNNQSSPQRGSGSAFEFGGLTMPKIGSETMPRLPSADRFANDQIILNNFLTKTESAFLASSPSRQHEQHRVSNASSSSKQVNYTTPGVGSSSSLSAKKDPTVYNFSSFGTSSGGGFGGPYNYSNVQSDINQTLSNNKHMMSMMRKNNNGKTGAYANWKANSGPQNFRSVNLARAVGQPRRVWGKPNRRHWGGPCDTTRDKTTEPNHVVANPIMCGWCKKYPASILEPTNNAYFCNNCWGDGEIIMEDDPRRSSVEGGGSSPSDVRMARGSKNDEDGASILSKSQSTKPGVGVRIRPADRTAIQWLDDVPIDLQNKIAGAVVKLQPELAIRLTNEIFDRYPDADDLKMFTQDEPSFRDMVDRLLQNVQIEAEEEDAEMRS